ncbi:Ycf48-like protein [Bythopirellula goksoeyrii]|uniref:Ycf48-like protein n=2 Tax=Bythopirellula goksoeyrii TaxID=1400387 RepID=A0A5B9QLV8_9BACT|nr:Ycf48-like protein [Bythopirellula goksoeyrii]
MVYCALRALLLLCVLVLPCTSPADCAEIKFKSIEICPSSRIDAIAYFGNGVVLAGTRAPDPGVIYRSSDYGITWARVGNITGTDLITCLASGHDGVGFLLTGNQAHVWRTEDYGETWEDLGKVSGAQNPVFANAYGLLVTSKGTLIVTDTAPRGGHIYRSLDNGNSWTDLGPISSKPLYRLLEVGDGVVANGWAGHVYKSKDDGLTWKDLGHLANSELYAFEYIPPHTILVGTEKGIILTSNDNGETWKDQGHLAPFADDFVWAGGENVLYSTYAGSRLLYLSENLGASWISLGNIFHDCKEDWIDHAIFINEPTHKAIVGGTNNGKIVYSGIPE